MNPYIIIAFLIALAGSAVGGYVKGGNDKEATLAAENAKKVELALEHERALQATINAATSDFINAQKKQLEKAYALPKIKLVNDCTVPADVGRLLNDAQRVHSDAGTGTKSSGTSKATNPAR